MNLTTYEANQENGQNRSSCELKICNEIYYRSFQKYLVFFYYINLHSECKMKNDGQHIDATHIQKG